MRLAFAERPTLKEKLHHAAPAATPATPRPATPAERDLSVLTDEQKKVYLALPDTPFALDALTAKGYAPSAASAALTLLELYGMVAARPGGLYEKL